MIDALFAGGQQYDTLARLRANYIRVVALFAIIVLSILMLLQLLNIVRVSESGPVETILSTGVFLALCGGLLLLVQRGLVRIATIIMVSIFILAVLTTPNEWLLLSGALAIVSAATLGDRMIFVPTAVIVLGRIGLNVFQAITSGQFELVDGVVLLTLLGVGMVTRVFVSQAERANETSRRNASLLQAVAETGEVLAKQLKLDELLTQAVELIRERFAFYHVQIFLLTEEGDYARLVASTGELGKRLLERHHQLAVGSQSVIGTVTMARKPVIARDTDPIYYRNELLPNTRSELALPIFDGDKLIGALDVQSRRIDAFDPEAVQALQVMSNLLGTSIRNARLFEAQDRSARETKRLFLEAETNLREIQRLNQQLTRAGWQQFLAERRITTGVTLTEDQLVPESDWTDTLLRASQTRQPITEAQDGKTVIAVPVILGNEVIGAIEVEPASSRQEAETLEMVKAVAGRLAMSLDKARLFEESQEATAREQRISDIVARYQTVSTVDDLLRITLAELSETLGAKRSAIRLGTVDPTVSLNGGSHS